MAPSAGRETNSITPLSAVVVLTFLASLGMGMLWNAIPFITQVEYGFSHMQNLLLYLVLSIVYVVTALAASQLLAVTDRWITARTMTGLMLFVQAAICAMPAVFDGMWMPWTLSIMVSASSTVLWPIVESLLAAGRHGRDMRVAIGIWNVTWTAAVAVHLWATAPLMETSPRLAIVGLGVLLLLSVCTLGLFRRGPAEHDVDVSASHVTNEYTLLLRAARIMLALSYVLESAFAPLLPHLLDRLDVALTWQTPLAATWIVSRVVALTLMWHLTFWRGRWGALLLGGAAMAPGFAVVVTAPLLSDGLPRWDHLRESGPSVSFEPLLAAIMCGLVGLSSLSALRPYRRALMGRRCSSVVEKSARRQSRKIPRP